MAIRNAQQTQQNLRAVANAVAQQRLEGLEVPPEVIEDLKRAARGEINIATGIKKTYNRFAHYMGFEGLPDE